MVYDLNPFVSIETCFMTQNMVFPLTSPVCIWVFVLGLFSCWETSFQACSEALLGETFGLVPTGGLWLRAAFWVLGPSPRRREGFHWEV